MAKIGFASVRSCGVTSLALGLAALWPQDRVLMELDPAGGSLAAVGGLPSEPGLVSLAASARRHSDPALVFEHGQVLPDGVPVVCGPPSAERARSALVMLSGLLARLEELDVDVLCDHGRLDPGGENVACFERSHLSVLACRPHLADLHALAGFFDGRSDCPRPLLVLIGDGPYPAEEIAEVFGTEVVGQVPWDTNAAAVIGTESSSGRQLARTPLVRAMRTLAAELIPRVRAHDDGADTRPLAGSASTNGNSAAEVRR